MEKRDFHIQVDVQHVGGENLQERMVESWIMGFLAVGLPFIPPMARVTTANPGRKNECHTLLYGIHAEHEPNAAQLRAAIRESLAIHAFPDATVDVTIYAVHRVILSADCDTVHPIQKGVLAA
jgi:hypothetical protein